MLNFHRIFHVVGARALPRASHPQKTVRKKATKDGNQTHYFKIWSFSCNYLHPKINVAQRKKIYVQVADALAQMSNAIRLLGT